MPKKKRVFVCFDFHADKLLKDFMVEKTRKEDSPFDVVDTSLEVAAPMEHWEQRARAAITRSDLVVVMVGSSTHKASGVLKEIKMAQEAVRPIVQVIGYKDGKPAAVPGAGKLYTWNWEKLKKQFG